MGLDKKIKPPNCKDNPPKVARTPSQRHWEEFVAACDHIRAMKAEYSKNPRNESSIGGPRNESSSGELPEKSGLEDINKGINNAAPKN